jgi:Flp pilus assembly protein TadG
MGCASERGTQIVEMALALPVLAMVMLAVLDFGMAVNIKQKLAGIARETARIGANQSPADLDNSNVATSGTVADLQASLATSLQAAGLNDCGLGATAANTGSAASFQWTYSTSTGCPGTLQVTIERGRVASAGTPKVIGTRVRIDYPFRFRLAAVAGLIAPGSTMASTTTISGEAYVPNMP